MDTDHIDTFEAELAALDVGLTRTDAAGFPAALADAVERPAVGVELPQAGVSLSDADVTADPTPAALDDAATGVTAAALGVADYGTVVVRPTGAGEEPVSLFPERHVAVLAASDLVAEMPAALEALSDAFGAGPATETGDGDTDDPDPDPDRRSNPDQGSSRRSNPDQDSDRRSNPDSEASAATDGGSAGTPGDAILATGPSATADMGALVQGVHGPRTVHVVLVEDR